MVAAAVVVAASSDLFRPWEEEERDRGRAGEGEEEEARDGVDCLVLIEYGVRCFYCGIYVGWDDSLFSVRQKLTDKFDIIISLWRVKTRL